MNDSKSYITPDQFGEVPDHCENYVLFRVGGPSSALWLRDRRQPSVSAMFSGFSGDFGSGAGGDGQGSNVGGRDRSRSRDGNRGDGRDADIAASGMPWHVQRDTLDDYMNKNLEIAVLERFAAVPHMKRRRLIVDCISKKVQEPNRYLNVCISNYLAQEQEKLICNEGVGSSPRIGPQGSPRMAGPPLNSPMKSPIYQNYSPGPSSRPESSGRGVSTMPRAETGAESSVPSWAAVAAAMWPTDKSGLMREVFKQLNADVRSRLSKLDCQTAAALAYALTLAAPADADATNDMLKRWVARHVMMTTPATDAAAHSEEIAKIMEVRMIVTQWNGLQATVVANAAKCVYRRTGEKPGRVTFLDPVVITRNKDESDEVAAFEKKHGYARSRDDCRNLTELDGLIDRESRQWKEKNEHVIFVNVLPPSPKFFNVEMRNRQHVLHMSEARWTFEVAQIMLKLRASLGETNVASLTFVPKGLGEEFETNVSAVFGQGLCPTAGAKSRVGQVPSMFSVPSGVMWHTVLKLYGDPCLELDGWRINPDVYKQDETSMPATKIIKNTMVTTFNERELNEEDKQMMQVYRMTNLHSGEHRLCSRSWWMMQYGVDETPLAKNYKDKFPCLEHIMAMTGLAASDGEGEACGVTRYCDNCETVLKNMVTGYEMNTMVNAMTNTIARALALWGGPAACQQEFALGPDGDKVHECGKNCVKNPRPTE